MEATALLRPAASRLQERRDIVRETILARADVGVDRSVFGRAFADCFIDRVTEALYDNTWTPLMTWIDATCRTHADSTPARAVFAAASPAVCEALRDMEETAPGSRDNLERLAHDVAQILANIGTEPANGATDALDDTDVLLASLVGELSSIDSGTAEHSRNVSAWSGRIAAKLDLPKAEVIKVTRGGLVHDVGKISTPQEILAAARALSDDEWTVMREHVLAGEEMIAKIPPLHQFCTIVRSHHERFDGLGYPDGLDRSRIPLSVRIVSVADAFNAMIGARTYRQSMSPLQAIEELKRCSGTQFDPRVVEVMIDVCLDGATR
jgi:putative nucleotidyltransferase with HDIG domain